MTTSYEQVAAEYYDPALHPTCHNLRVGSEVGLQEVFESLEPCAVPYLELGAGASLAGHAVFSSAVVVCVDLNSAMLAHSTAGYLAVADAFQLPTRSAVFEGVFGSLIDPFNVPELYAEIRRVLRPGGWFVFSVPDVTWVRHNQAAEALPPHSAGITLLTGETVIVPSYVWSYAEQEHHLREAGFSDVSRIDVPVDALAPESLSRRFLGDDGKAGFEHVVSVYRAA